MDCVISPADIAARIEQHWVTGDPHYGDIAFQEPGRLDKLDAYIEWLSKHWAHFSDAERELLIAGGVALFEAKVNSW